MAESSSATLTARSSLHARTRPDVPAIIFEGSAVTYAELHRRSNQSAHALLAAGLTRGGRVAYLGRETDYYYDLALACAKSGTVLVPVNWRLTAVEVDHILRDSHAEVLFVEPEFRKVVDRIRADLPTLRLIVDLDGGKGFADWKREQPDTDLNPGTGTDDPVVQMYTSGTTGMPKGVVLAHRTFFTFIANTRRYGLDWIDWRPTDRSLSLFPGLHAGGMAWFMHCFNVGATSVIVRMFIPEEVVRLVKDEGITTIWAAPAMLHMLLSEPAASREQFAGLRKIVYGGSSITRELMLRCAESFPCELVQAYASAETGSFVTCLTAAEHVADNPKLASAGRVIPGGEVRIIDESGAQVPAGHLGRVCVRSDARFLEYWNRPTATAEMVHGEWLHMGDSGYLDEDGYLFLRDRINDTIIVAGQNIYPVEVEEAVRAHPAVADVAVYGVPNERWGETVHAAVVLRNGQRATPRELMRFMRGMIADFKIPTSYAFVDDLPRNPTGKVLRRILREEHVGRV